MVTFMNTTTTIIGAWHICSCLVTKNYHHGYQINFVIYRHVLRAYLWLPAVCLTLEGSCWSWLLKALTWGICAGGHWNVLLAWNCAKYVRTYLRQLVPCSTAEAFKRINFESDSQQCVWVYFIKRQSWVSGALLLRITAHEREPEFEATSSGTP